MIDIRTKIIEKKKKLGISLNSCESSPIENKELTKFEKKMNQKIKNRISAQESREKKKRICCKI